MRDLYDRVNKLNNCISRINIELEESDLERVLSFVQYMQDKEKSILWIVRCITAILLLRKQLGKPFRDATKDDIRSLFKWMDSQKYKASTHEKFRVILKMFYKFAFGDNEYYPDCVKWFSVSVGKERYRQEKDLDIEEYLEEEEIQKLVNNASTIQKKAFIACLYESGARPEEFLTLTNRDVKIDTKGIVIILRGKTGERRVRIISFSNLLQHWLSIHPLKDQQEFSLWISESSNYKHKPLGLRGAEKILETTMIDAELTNKQHRLYILRHSRATHLSKHFSEAQMWIFFGWTPGTKVVRKYIHLTGKDVDNALLALNEGKQVLLEDYKLKPIICIRCNDKISPDSIFCSKCGLSIDQSKEYLEERKIEDKIQLLEKQTENMREEMNQKFTKILKVIQQNSDLLKVKPDRLLNKLE